MDPTVPVPAPVQPVNPQPPPVPAAVPPVAPAAQPQPAAQAVYAGFWRRWAAVFIDGLIVSLLGFVAGLIEGFFPESSFVRSLMSVLSFVVGMAYPVYFIGAKGQTPGKMAMKIKVVKLTTGAVPGYGSAFLREIVGKIISSMILLLGYLWMLWDAKKQTWHDKIAGTVVIRV